MAMGLFEHEARQFKFDVLREVAVRAYENTCTPNIEDELAYKLIPTTKADFRCCVYKEREIIRQRTRLAIGKSPNIRRKEDIRPKQIVQVLEAACDGCTIKKIQITDNCRKCMAKSCMSACRFDAVHMGADRAIIDYDKCKECGACVKVCPFMPSSRLSVHAKHHVLSMPLPWMKTESLRSMKRSASIVLLVSQPVLSELLRTPRGSVPVIQLINLETPMIAMIAPSIQGQFDSANLDQIKSGIRMLGFTDVVEVAAGADAVAWYEKNELKQKMSEGVPMTTSCCPAFLNLAKQHFPSVYEKNMSTMASPMFVMARMLKKKYPNTGVVFIGPCVAKKQEAMSEGMFPDVDYVLTYEEVAAMLVAKRIYLNDIKCETHVEASVFGRNFAFGQGVSKALIQAANEDGGFTFKGEYADGCQECKKQLMILKAGRFTSDILEGMSCKGGCGNGPAIIDNSIKVKVRFDLENSPHKHKTIKDTIEQYGFEDIDMHRHSTKEIKSW
jgi:ferredoxin hydrogenase large subunit